LNLLEVRMHLEVMRFELIYFIEVFLAVLAGVSGMDLAVMPFPLHLAFKLCATFLTFILILSHLCLLSTSNVQRLNLKNVISRQPL
jgi:hypothetical protein